MFARLLMHSCLFILAASQGFAPLASADGASGASTPPFGGMPMDPLALMMAPANMAQNLMQRLLQLSGVGRG
ncbi:hypothetical protein BIW11_10973 [Tropilaelaps mercedesae]|uniref:Uncharacterized protein n=1 Tax=Tropilaelaps mercedesae TaxID=418985 RepID=A0A1V9XDG5_9ACAR|nr:hypothetical protein BIW11_10973 [Tropilaelaps mercedesae]